MVMQSASATACQGHALLFYGVSVILLLALPITPILSFICSPCCSLVRFKAAGAFIIHPRMPVPQAEEEPEGLFHLVRKDLAGKVVAHYPLVDLSESRIRVHSAGKRRQLTLPFRQQPIR